MKNSCCTVLSRPWRRYRSGRYSGTVKIGRAGERPAGVAWGVRATGESRFGPPVGNRRWRPPQPVIPWKGVLAANDFSAACMQSEAGWTDNNCRPRPCTRVRLLYLNVWTPAASAGERLPVLVWIHAGAGLWNQRPGHYDGMPWRRRAWWW